MRARAFTWAGILVTGLLLAAASLWYPGEDAGARPGHSFGDDFLSMMGRTRTRSHDNTVSCLIFNGALILGGSVLALFWKARASFLARPETGAILRRCGWGMGLAMAGIGLTPCDCFPQLHHVMTHAAIGSGVVCFGLCLVGSRRGFESARSRAGWLATLCGAGAVHGVFLVLILQGRIPSQPALPLMQKLFVLLLALWAGWQAFLFGRAHRLEDAVWGRGVR